MIVNPKPLTLNHNHIPHIKKRKKNIARLFTRFNQMANMSESDPLASASMQDSIQSAMVLQAKT